MIDILIMVLIFLAWFSIKRICGEIQRRLELLEERQEKIMAGVFKLTDDTRSMAINLTANESRDEKSGTYYRSDPRFDKDDGQAGFHAGLDD